MKKYKIDRDLSKIARQKAPSNIYLYPIVNMVMKLSTCISDDKVVVNKYVTPGYENGKLTTFVIEPQKCNGILPSILSWWRIFTKSIKGTLSDCKMVCGNGKM